MKPTIVKNNKNLRNLNSLITNGFYKGYVENEKFELIRNHFPNNYRIIGVLNDTGSYDVKFDYKSTMGSLAKTLLITGVLTSIFLIINNNWAIPIIFILTSLITLIGYKIKEKKEMNLFIDKLLDVY